MANRTQAQRRYLVLIRQLEAEMGDGWQTALANRWGIAPSLLSKQRAGLRCPGQKAIDAAIVDLRLDSRFFYDETLPDEPDYHEHILGVKPTRSGVAYPSFAEWLETSPYAKRLEVREVLGAGDDAEILRRLSAQRFEDGDPGVEAYEALARNAAAKRRAATVQGVAKSSVRKRA